MPNNVQGDWTIMQNKGALWPASGKVLELLVEESPDGGATWNLRSWCDLTGGDSLDKSGNVITSGAYTVTPMYRGTNCRIRLTIKVYQACDIGADLTA